MQEIQINSQTFRIKKMNMIEMLALQSQITFKSVDSTLNLYNELLERMEVQIGDKWLPVKEKGKNIFYPNELENDFETVQALIGFFLKYVQSVFRKSDESNSQQESNSSETNSHYQRVVQMQ